MNSDDVVMPSGQSRRQFVKVFVQIGAYFGVCAPVGRFFISEVRAQTAGLTGIFNASLSDPPFTALQQLNGSVRVEVPNGAGITPLVATSNAVPSVIITRVATSGSDQFGTLSQRCTHEGFAVNPKAAGQNYLQCPLHGSRFNPANGAVILGPAATPLTAYLTLFNPTPAPGSLQIRIANIGYTIAASVVTATQGQRVRLQFPTRSQTNYEVRFRSTVTGAESVLPFFTTQNATTPVMSVAGTGAILSAFLTPPQQVGFYVIAAKP